MEYSFSMIRTCYKCLNEFVVGENGCSNNYLCPTCYEDFKAKHQEWLRFGITPILGDPNFVPEIVEKFKISENKEN